MTRPTITLAAALALATIAATADARPGDRRDRDNRASQQPDETPPDWPLIVGAIVILDDGSECRVIEIDASGQAWCIPLTPQAAPGDPNP